MVNPPTVLGSAAPAGSRVQKAPALADRRKIPVTCTAICLPVVATWRASVLPGRRCSMVAVTAGTATGSAVSAAPPAARGGQVPATRTARRDGSGSEMMWVCACWPPAAAGMFR